MDLKWIHYLVPDSEPQAIVGDSVIINNYVNIDIFFCVNKENEL